MDLKFKLCLLHYKLLKVDILRERLLISIHKLEKEIAEQYPGKKITITEDFEILVEGD